MVGTGLRRGIEAHEVKVFSFSFFSSDSTATVEFDFSAKFEFIASRSHQAITGEKADSFRGRKEVATAQLPCDKRSTAIGQLQLSLQSNFLLLFPPQFHFPSLTFTAESGDVDQGSNCILHSLAPVETLKLPLLPPRPCRPW